MVHHGSTKETQLWHIYDTWRDIQRGMISDGINNWKIYLTVDKQSKNNNNNNYGNITKTGDIEICERHFG